MSENNTIIFDKQNKIKVSKALEKSISFEELTREEWHQFIQHYNYDDGIKPMQWLIRQKICDKGTALCLYWLLEPGYYETEETRDLTNPQFQLIIDIEKNFISGFYESEEFSYNPADDYKIDSYLFPFVPKEMLEKTPGVRFDKLKLDLAFIREPNEKELATIQKKIKEAVGILQMTKPNFTPADSDETIQEIANSIEFWKNKDHGKMKIKTLHYLFNDCVHKKYGWDWTVWDWETGCSTGISQPSRKWSIIGDTIIRHTSSGFRPTTLIINFFKDLEDLDGTFKNTPNPYSGIGLLMITN